MPPRKLRSPLALVVLGLLAEEPLHPYAMRQRISERAHDRLPGVRPASLYDVVQRLADAGLVSAGEPSREGNRPERVSYVITGAGRDALTGWVAESLRDPAHADEFPAALSFMYALGPDRVTEILRARAQALGESIAAAEAALAGAEGGRRSADLPVRAPLPARAPPRGARLDRRVHRGSANRRPQLANPDREGT